MLAPSLGGLRPCRAIPCTARGSRQTAHRRFVTRCAKGDVLLQVNDLHAKVADSGKEILKGVTLTIREGEVHAIMGKNGSGKSTLSKVRNGVTSRDVHTAAQVLVGHPDYEVTGGSVTYKGKNLLDMEPEERSHEGVFLSFQSPIEVPGVSNIDFLRLACNARRKAKGDTELDPIEFYGYLMPKLELLNMDVAFLNRNVNEGFSGGEKKRNEILQLACLEVCTLHALVAHNLEGRNTHSYKQKRMHTHRLTCPSWMRSTVGWTLMPCGTCQPQSMHSSATTVPRSWSHITRYTGLFVVVLSTLIKTPCCVLLTGHVL